MAHCSGLLLVILHRHNEEDKECDSLNGSQEEEVVIQCALVDVTYRERKKKVRKKKSEFHKTPISVVDNNLTHDLDHKDHATSVYWLKQI